MNRLLNTSVPVALAAFLLGGCATYSPATLAELPVGGPVRVQVTREAYAQLPQISDLPGDQFAGTLVRRSASELVLHIPLAPGSLLGQDVKIPVSGIVVGEVRRTSMVRSSVAMAMGVGVVVGAILASHHSGPQVEPQPDYTSHEESFTGLIARALSFSIPVP